MNYFFVFQNKTYEQESRGGYLWAPQRGNLGRRVSHWEKMKSVKQGDIIIHSYKTQIMAISIAKQDVYVAKRPAELSSEWQTEGWRVDTEYVPFTNVIKTTDHKNRLLKLQPQKDAQVIILGSGQSGEFISNGAGARNGCGRDEGQRAFPRKIGWAD